MDFDLKALVFYVYVYFRPWDGSPCYVGKGKGRRWVHHEKWATNRHLANIIAKAGGDVPKIKVRENLTEAQACEIEMTLIAAIGRLDLGTGPLVNMTDGGEGMSGYRHSPEARAKLKASWVDRPDRQEKLAQLQISRPHSEATLAKLRNKKVSTSARANMSVAQRTRCANPEELARRRAAKLGTSVSVETRAKIRVSLLGRIVTAETRAKISAVHKGRKKPKLSAEHKAKISAAGLGRRHTAETKEKVAAAKRDKPLSAEHRAAISATKTGKPGHLHSLETRAKMSMAHRARALGSQGSLPL